MCNARNVWKQSRTEPLPLMNRLLLTCLKKSEKHSKDLKNNARSWEFFNTTRNFISDRLPSSLFAVIKIRR
jgi:hypothetical protein